MEILEKYANLKSIRLLGIVIGGIVTAIGLIGFISSDMILSMITIMVGMYYILVLGTIGLVALSGYYYYKKQKDTIVLFHFVSGIVLLCALLFSYSAISVLQAYSSGNFLSILGVDYGSVSTASTMLKIAFFVGLAIFAVDLILHLGDKGIMNSDVIYKIFPQQAKNAEASVNTGADVNGQQAQNAEASVNTGADVNRQQVGTQSAEQQPSGQRAPAQPVESIVVKAKAFLKTQTGKMVVAIVAIAIVAFVGYKVYDTYFNKTTLDVTENLEVTFFGNDGSGTASLKSNDVGYDTDDFDKLEFVYSLRYDYENQGKLSNGDFVLVTVSYNEDLAEELKLNVVNTTKKIKIEGLTEIYENASDFDKKIATALKKDSLEELEDDLESYSDLKDTKVELYKMYYGYKSANYNKVIAVYKVTGTDGEEEKVYYYGVETSDADAEYLEDSYTYWYASKLRDKKYNSITEESKVEEALEDDNSQYKFSEFK